MQVILLQDVDNLGLRGDVVDVARGYARNFLLPRRLAEQASPARVAELEKRDRNRARHEAASIEQARDIAAVLAQAELRFDVKAGATGSLFGSVTATDVADRLWDEHKVRVDRRKIDLSQPIKQVGRYAIAIDVFQDVTVDVATIVVPEGGELPPDEPEQAAEVEPAEGAAEPAADATVEAEVVEIDDGAPDERSEPGSDVEAE
jgi:large subunit ribosomal protein L9